jgi:cysteine desulfuration protein SufE
MLDLQRYEEYAEALDMLDDDMRFEYILDLAKKNRNQPFPEDAKDDAHLMHGCMSKVWIVHEERDGRHYFQGTSDAAIVNGLVTMMTDSFSGLTREELAAITLDHVRRLNLGALTTQRQVGMMAMLKHLQKLAGARPIPAQGAA